MATSGFWSRYPPCVSQGCTDVLCCSMGGKLRWPEVVGKKGEVAKAIIEREAPSMSVVFLRPGAIRIEDFCCNRVFVILDQAGNVLRVPTIG